MLTSSRSRAGNPGRSKRHSAALAPEFWLSIVASMVMALMVAAAGTALAGPSDMEAMMSRGPTLTPDHPLVICRTDYTGYRCIPEAS